MNLIKIGGDNFILDFKAMNELISETGDIDKSMTGQEIETKYIYESLDDTGIEKLTSRHVTVREYDKGKEIDVSKYETLRMIIDIVMAQNEGIDDTLGVERAMKTMPISFKIAFNTLLYYKVLRKIEI